MLSVFFAVSMGSVAGCGAGPDSSALVGGSGELEGETEFETTSDARETTNTFL
jgi:hypothetical protein